MFWLIVTAVAAYLVQRVIIDYVRFRAMPGMGTYYPVLGHLPGAAANSNRIIQYIRDCAIELKFPKVFLLKVGFWEPPRYVITSPKDIEHVLKTNFENYEISRGLRGDALRDLLGNGIFNADGHTWITQRKLASREFSANRFRTFMSAVFNRSAAKLVRNFGSDISAAKSGVATIDLHRWFFTLTLDAFSEIAFGLNLGGLDGKPQPFIGAFDKCQEQCFNRTMRDAAVWRLHRLLNISREGEMRAALDTIDKFVYSVMDDLLAGKRSEDSAAIEDGDDDLLRRLLPAAKKEDGTHDRVFVRDMLLSLIIAGRDTTAASMSWTMFELMKHPKCIDEILEELQTNIGSAAPNFDNVSNCHYLQACLSESQRLWPSVPFDPRTAVKEDLLPDCGLRIQAGDTVAYSNAVQGLHPEIWGADAAEYKPSRWIQEDGTCKKEDQFKYPAFHAGRRLCLGLDMANLEMKVVISTLLRNFTFKLVPNQIVEPGTALTLQMRDGVKAFVEKRRS